MNASLKAPFPYFGGKSLVAAEVWARFGAVENYVEPFCGSAAVLLGRPAGARGPETVNDANCFISNFWRAMAAGPDEVAAFCDWPINEADLHARHRWLMTREGVQEWRERMKTDADFFDAQVAGWWVWGASCWIGSGWCADDGNRLRGRDGGASNKIPQLTATQGVQSLAFSRKLPNVLCARSLVSGADVRRPHLGRPYAINAAQEGADAADEATPLVERFRALQARLRRVRVCCGDWARVCTPAVTTYLGITGVFLDPPYADTAGRTADVYAVDDLQVAHAVREWAIANGDNPLFRIALCGYEGEHVMPDSWAVFAWKTQGGYGHTQKKGNRVRERIWFSPHCLAAQQGGLFDGVAA